jgi:alkylation response protein AidB-like acyl-CoA dehydrogenase
LDFNLSTEQLTLLAGAERFVREHYDADQRARLAATDSGFSTDHWAQFADLGWLSLPLPEDVTGIGFALEDVSVLMEQFGRGLILEPYLTTAVLCARIIDQSVSHRSRRQLLQAIAGGKLRVALAYSEFGEDFDPRIIAATADGLNDGGFCLNGLKTMVFDAPSADKLIVSACMETGTPVLLLLDSSLPGIELSDYELIDGTRAADIRFQQVELSAEALLAGGNSAVDILDEALDRGTLARMAEAVGVMEGCLDVTSAYVKERRQFGQAIGNFQALQHILADMFIATQESRSMLYHGIAHARDEDLGERKKALSLAKIAIAQSSHLVSANGIQLHGGYGVTDEYVISRYHRRLITIEKAFGDQAYHTRRYIALSDALEA